MREQVLRDFFEGRSSAEGLERDIAGSIKQSGPKTTVISIEDMDTDFNVTSDMAVRLCDAVLCGELRPEAARTAVLSAFADLAFTTGDSIQANKGRPRP